MAGRERTVTVKFLGDEKGAVQAANKTGSALDRLGPIGNRISGVISSMQGRLSGLGSIGEKVSGGLGKVSNGIAAVGPAGQALAAGLAVGVGAVTAFVSKSVGEFARLGQTVRDFQRVSGASASDASRFVSVLDDMGVEAEAGSKALSKMSRDLDTGKLKAYGVQVEKAADGNVDLIKTLLNVSDAYVATHDPAQRAEIRFAAFGKQGDALIPILEKGGEALKQMFADVPKGELFDQADLDKAEKLRLSMDRLDDSVKNIERNAGRSIVPWITDAANGVAKLAETADSASPKVKTFVGGFLDAVPVVGPLKQLGDVLGVVGSESSKTAEKQQRLQEQLHNAAVSAEEQEKALDSLNKAIVASFDSELGLETALDKLEDTNRTLTEAIKARDDAVRISGRGSAAALAAEEVLSDALRDARGDYLAAANAAVRFADDQAAASGRTLDAATRTGIYKSKLEELLNSLAPGSPLRAALQGYIDQLNTIPTDINTRVSVTSTFATSGKTSAGGVPQKSNIPLRAKGGPVKKGEPYIVGENGPELRVDDTDGRIIPLDSASRSGAALGGHVTIENHFHVGTVVGSNGMREFAAMVTSEQQKQQKRDGRSPLAASR